MKRVVIAALVLCGGCMSQQKAERVITTLPPYMQDRIGPVNVDMRLTWLFATGECEVFEPNCPVAVAPWASEKVLVHECFHSFEFNTYYDHEPEWHRFQQSFGDYDYIGMVPMVLMSQVPFLIDMPVEGYANIYGQSAWCEDTATIFAEVWEGNERPDTVYMKKYKAVSAFVDGDFQE